jgi:hypothetical protein
VVKYVVLAAGCIVLLMWAEGCQRDRQSAWEARADAALAQSEQDRQAATEAQRWADLYAARADSAIARADSLAHAGGRVIERIRTVIVPAEAIPYTAPRDTAIAILTAEVGALRGALRDRTAEADELRNANALLAGNVARLEGVLRDGPKPDRRWMPVVVVGAAAGMDTGGRLFAGPAVSVGWRVRL